jgi:hypothetical protein
MLKDVIAVYFANHMKHTFGQSVELLIANAGGPTGL